jgi:hypothetical protein
MIVRQPSPASIGLVVGDPVDRPGPPPGLVGKALVHARAPHHQAPNSTLVELWPRRGVAQHRPGSVSARDAVRERVPTDVQPGIRTPDSVDERQSPLAECVRDRRVEEPKLPVAFDDLALTTFLVVVVRDEVRAGCCCWPRLDVDHRHSQHFRASGRSYAGDVTTTGGTGSTP